MKNQGILTFLIFLLAILGVWFVVIPGVGEILATQQRISQYAAANTVAGQIKLAINKQYGSYDAEKAKAHEYLQAVPDSVSQSDLLAEIGEIAALSGISPEGVDIDVSQANRNQAAAGQTAPALRSVPVKISLSGDYPSIRQFLNLMERNLPILDGSEMTISPGSTGEKTEKKAANTFTVQVTFQTYALK